MAVLDEPDRLEITRPAGFQEGLGLLPVRLNSGTKRQMFVFHGGLPWLPTCRLRQDFTFRLAGPSCPANSCHISPRPRKISGCVIARSGAGFRRLRVFRKPELPRNFQTNEFTCARRMDGRDLVIYSTTCSYLSDHDGAAADRGIPEALSLSGYFSSTPERPLSAPAFWLP
jgi:hypothetical protein